MSEAENAGADMASQKKAIEAMKKWLTTDFEGGRHLRRVDKIDDEPVL